MRAECGYHCALKSECLLWFRTLPCVSIIGSQSGLAGPEAGSWFCTAHLRTFTSCQAEAEQCPDQQKVPNLQPQMCILPRLMPHMPSARADLQPFPMQRAGNPAYLQSFPRDLDLSWPEVKPRVSSMPDESHPGLVVPPGMPQFEASQRTEPKVPEMLVSGPLSFGEVQPGSGGAVLNAVSPHALAWSASTI